MAHEDSTDISGAPARSDQSGLKQRWLSFLSSPEGKGQLQSTAAQAGLLQAGVSLLSPRPGEPFATSLARGVSEGGQAVGRVQAQERADAATVESERTTAEAERLGRRGASTDEAAVRERGRATDVRAGSEAARTDVLREQVAATDRRTTLQDRLATQQATFDAALSQQERLDARIEMLFTNEQLVGDLKNPRLFSDIKAEAEASLGIGTPTRTLTPKQIEGVKAATAENLVKKIQEQPDLREAILQTVDPEKASKIRSLLGG